MILVQRWRDVAFEGVAAQSYDLYKMSLKRSALRVTSRRHAGYLASVKYEPNQLALDLDVYRSRCSFRTSIDMLI